MSDKRQSANQPNDAKNKWQEVEEHEREAVASETEESVGIEFPSRENLEDQLTAFEQQTALYREKMLLAQAELDNVRKRADRDVQNAHLYANDKLLTEMLPVVDSLVRALEKKPTESPTGSSLYEGIQLTLDLLEKTLFKFGVEAMVPETGDAFNPEHHEAMSLVPTSDVQSGCVLQLLQKGYSLHGRVLRAAMVIVAQ